MLAPADLYGTTAGTPTQMQRTVSNLLRAVVYPDSTNTGTDSGDIDSDSSDVVSYAYDALGAQVYTKDQVGTVIETDYDTAGRQLHRRATATGSGIATDVLRITMAYTTRGQMVVPMPTARPTAGVMRTFHRDCAAAAAGRLGTGAMSMGINRSRGAVVRPQQPAEALPALDAIRRLGSGLAIDQPVA